MKKVIADAENEMSEEDEGSYLVATILITVGAIFGLMLIGVYFYYKKQPDLSKFSIMKKMSLKSLSQKEQSRMSDTDDSDDETDGGTRNHIVVNSAGSTSRYMGARSFDPELNP